VTEAAERVEKGASSAVGVGARGQVMDPVGLAGP